VLLLHKLLVQQQHGVKLYVGHVVIVISSDARRSQVAGRAQWVSLTKDMSRKIIAKKVALISNQQRPTPKKKFNVATLFRSLK
jgi:hypothetical protein